MSKLGHEGDGNVTQSYHGMKVWWVKTNSAKNFGSVITWARDMIFLQKKSVICYWPDSPTYISKKRKFVLEQIKMSCFANTTYSLFAYISFLHCINSEPVKTVAHKKLWWGCGGSHCIKYIKGTQVQSHCMKYIKGTKPLHRVYQRYNENGAPDKKAWRIEVVALGLPSFNRSTLQRQMPPYDQHLGQLHRISQGEIIS